MKPLWTTSCLLFHAFWSEAVNESLHIATEYSKVADTGRYLANVHDALDAASRRVEWLNEWKQSTFA